MYCSYCGNQMDDDNKFCSCCGNAVRRAMPAGKQASNINGRPVLVTGKKKIRKNIIIGVAAIAIVLIAVLVCVKLMTGGFGSTPAEKMFLMSVEDTYNMSFQDVRDMLDAEDISYRVEDKDLLKTKTSDTFMGNDCLYYYIESHDDWDWDYGWDPEAYKLHSTMLCVAYETEKDYEKGCEKLDKMLRDTLIEDAGVLQYESDFDIGTSSVYIVEDSENVDLFDGIIADRIAMDDAASMTYHVYKVVQVCHTPWEDSVIFDEDDFSDDKSYAEYTSQICVSYMLMSPEYLWYSMIMDFGYDMEVGQEIDVAEFGKSLDDGFIDAIDIDDVTEGFSKKERKQYKNQLFSKIYMMEKYNYDADRGLYCETDEEKRLWYIDNFQWDKDAGLEIDLSSYGDNVAIYCAIECNYDVDHAKYFEDDLDKAVYLSEQNFNPDTKESFESEEEKRLYFMQNYCYDTSTGEAVDKEVVDALIAYDKFILSMPEIQESESIGYTLIYLNEDEIPECLVWTNPYSFDATVYGMMHVLSYNNGTVQMYASESVYLFQAAFSYTPKRNKFCIETVLGLRSATDWFMVELESDFSRLGSAWQDNTWDEYYFYLNDVEVQEEELDAYINSFDFETTLYTAEAESLLSAYDALNTVKYTTWEFCIYQFEINDGILTVSADEGANANFESGDAFSFSYPIAEDCIWEDSYGFNDNNQGLYYVEQIDAESVKKEIESWRGYYETDPDNMNSPVAIRFCILDEEVIGVYTSTP